MRLARGKRLATLFEITRADGQVFRFTDHDRKLSRHGQTFSPMDLGSVSAERRESGLRNSRQEATGQVAGEVTYADLIGGKFRGAQLVQRLVDWRNPEMMHNESHKVIRDIVWDGTRYKAMIESLTTQLERPKGGRFGGVTNKTCGYTLGEPNTCRASGLGPMMAVATEASGTFTNLPSLSMTVSVTLTTNALAGHWLIVTDGDADGVMRQIESNTTNAITIREAWPPGRAPSSGDAWKWGKGAVVLSVPDKRRVARFTATGVPIGGGSGSAAKPEFYREGAIRWVAGQNAGVTSPIIEWNEDTTSSPNLREATLLIPTPFDIATNDRGILLPGCDGLKQTCIDKFDNVANFGGQDTYVPGPEQILSATFAEPE